MKQYQLFLFFSVVALGAWAQPAVSRDTTRDQTAPEYRRAELRSVLKEPRAREAQEKVQIFENVAYNRHLSEQERADLRQQLRRPGLDGKPVRP